ncbi:Gfo/Idh/MocA family oxidoreductase [Ideonella azotifigens]|uniref:Gfo/Idh/MocA family oxidoreductase n=1 Tax=Ideonella azotifigens TaxID=513160 RepID=A0ABP3VGL9_9BURK|nr:Gfo/Idh/MocA family oxidoreductase [Ideonella azotifigens]MCD2344331.1 Gfo/Idh/MocA family oxidoreductase [Ideonella azotifigens]
MALKLGLVGIGKIARDQHIPALTADPRFELVACASRNARVDGVANFADVETMLAEVKDLDAISICTPPQAHFEAALAALRAGKHVMLEKPPAATTRHIALLQAEAQRQGRTLFQTWHSRLAAGVDAAREWLSSRTLTGGTITWKEDVHHWHPGQQWIFEPGGLGVFDPGINALSVLTEVLPGEAVVHEATLDFPENQQAPIAAQLALRTEAGVMVNAEFDFRQKGEQTWDIELVTTTGRLKLTHGGGALQIDGQPLAADAALAGEYPRLYARFAELCMAGESEVDWRPFQLVADAFLVGRRRIVAAHQV